MGKLETSLAINQERAVDWQEIPGAEGRYSAGVSVYVEYPYNNLLRLKDQTQVFDGHLSLHLRQHFGDNDAPLPHGVPVICNYRVYGPDRHLLVDPTGGPFLVPYDELKEDEWFTWCVIPLLSYLTITFLPAGRSSYR